MISSIHKTNGIDFFFECFFIPHISCMFQDLIYCAVYIVFYFIANCVLAAQSCGKDNNKAGTVSYFTVCDSILLKAYFDL